MINALNAIIQIIVNKNLMKMLMDNAYAKMATMIMAKIIYANNALNFGIYIKTIFSYIC